MGKPRDCNCCDPEVPFGFLCVHCNDSGDAVCTESLTEAQCSGVSGIYLPGSCDTIGSAYCGKCSADFDASPCESFFLSKSGPVQGDSNVFASGSYNPEKPLDLEHQTQFISHFKRGHQPRIYKGTGTHGWLSGIVPIGSISTQGVNARLEFVNNQFPYIEGSHSADIEYIGLCDKRQDPKTGCATIKFKNTVVGSTTEKLDKFHLKIGTFQRYGDNAILSSILVANNRGIPARYVGPFTSASEHKETFSLICGANQPGHGHLGIYETIPHLMSYFNGPNAGCYGSLNLACCSKLTKSVSAIYEFDVSSFPIDTCFQLHNFAAVSTSSSSYGYFELTGETYVKPTTSFGNGSFFEYSVPYNNYCGDPTSTNPALRGIDTFFDNQPGCPRPTQGFDCNPPPPPPPPVTTTTTQDPCPPDSPSVIHCRYDYIESNSADDPPGHKKWRRKGFPFSSNCECDCPSIAQIANEWNSANGGEPQIGQCADAYVPCCKPNSPPFCLDYTVTFNPECGTTTTTTEGPTTTTTTTLPPEPTAVVACLGKKPDCCDDPAFTVVGDNCCQDDPQGRIYRRPPRDCTDFSSFQEASQYHQDLSLGGYLAYLFSNKTCAELQPTLESMTCEECACATTTTTSGPLGACCSRLLTQPTFNCQDNVAASQCPPPGIFDMEFIHHPGVSCSSNPCPTTTTTQGPTTTTTQGPTTTSTQGPTTTSTQGPTTTTTQGPTTTSAPTTTTTSCPCPCPQSLSWPVFMNSTGGDCSFSASDTASDTISNYDGGCNGIYNYTDAGTFPCGDSWTTSMTCDSSKAATDTDRWSGSFSSCNISINAPAGADDPSVLGSCSAPPTWTVTGVGLGTCFCCEDTEDPDPPDPEPPEPDPEDPDDPDVPDDDPTGGL